MAPPASAVVTSSVFGMWFKRLKAKICQVKPLWDLCEALQPRHRLGKCNGMCSLRPPSCSLSLETAQAFDCALPFLFGTDVPDSVCRAESQAGRGTVPCTSWVAVVDFGTG